MVIYHLKAEHFDMEIKLTANKKLGIKSTLNCKSYRK